MKNKTCMICKTTIIIPSEEYVKVEHFNEEGKELSKGFYHVKCFRDRLNNNNAQNQVAQKAFEILDKIGMRI